MKKGVLLLVVSVAIGLFAACGRGSSETKSTAPVPISTRGPGMHRQPAGALQLPVPRTFDLTHVEPQHFAAALGNDPTRLFNWVRDEIAYEVYTGCLRGPRGTLLAMAGNSVDRAALLASMLQHAGQKVRFARGTLSDADAKELVTSMWADRPTAAAAVSPGEPPAAVKAVGDMLVEAVNRDYLMIHEQLKKLASGVAADPGPTVDQLVAEVRRHYWVQWAKDGGWIDLDPSFGDAAPGHAYARAEENSEGLPESLFHRIEIRVKLEEYSGDAPATREILRYSAKASDLSAVDVALSHQPENWSGPVASLQSAIGSAVKNTGRIKPVLVLPATQWVIGETFAPKLKTAGIGSIEVMLGGEGTRKPATLATAESIEFDFISPNGRRETVVREIFDLVGPARRAAGRRLTAEEVRTRTDAPDAVDLTTSLYDMFFSTGHMDPTNVSRTAQESTSPEPGLRVRRVLRRLNVAVLAVIGALPRQTGRKETGLVLLYPDSPNVSIAERSAGSGRTQLRFDLRRHHLRAVMAGGSPAIVRSARVLQGVTDGTLERIVMEYMTAEARQNGTVRPEISTSSVFELSTGAHVTPLLLPNEIGQLGAAVPADALARVRQEFSNGYIVIAPQQPVAMNGVARFAWWRVDTRSGETTAVTDEGLHQTGSSYVIFEDREAGEAEVFEIQRDFFGPGRNAVNPYENYNLRDPQELTEYLDFLQRLIARRIPYYIVNS